MTDEILVALSALSGEDRDMMLEAVLTAARQWRKEAADARLMMDMGEIDRRLKTALAARMGDEA